MHSYRAKRNAETMCDALGKVCEDLRLSGFVAVEEAVVERFLEGNDDSLDITVLEHQGRTRGRIDSVWKVIWKVWKWRRGRWHSSSCWWRDDAGSLDDLRGSSRGRSEDAGADAA